MGKDGTRQRKDKRSESSQCVALDLSIKRQLDCYTNSVLVTERSVLTDSHIIISCGVDCEGLVENHTWVDHRYLVRG